MKFKILVLFGALLTNVKIFAQTDFRPGYIINISGDTIFGEIDYQGDLLMRKICRFKSAKNNILEYSPTEISAYRFIDSKYYVSREINHERYFLEFLIKGQINIYYMRDKEGIHYFLDKKDVKLTEIPYEEYYKYVDNKEMLFKSTYHINLLRFYMQDDTLSQARIQQISKPNHENLIKLSQDYHNSVCPDERCIVYKKKQPLIKVNIEALSGVIDLVNNEELNDKYYLQSGIIAHFEMPGTKRSSLKQG